MINGKGYYWQNTDVNLDTEDRPDQWGSFSKNKIFVLKRDEENIHRSIFILKTSCLFVTFATRNILK